VSEVFSVDQQTFQKKTRKNTKCGGFFDFPNLIAHCGILFLARCVQNIQKTRITVNGDLLAIAVFDGRVVLLDKVVLN
jgi:hypothetical protein